MAGGGGFRCGETVSNLRMTSRALILSSMPLIAALKNSSARNQDKVAIACDEQSFTYCEMDRLTDNIASNLRGHDIEPGDRVAIHLLNGPELALTIVGCLKAGGVPVPLNARLRGREID